MKNIIVILGIVVALLVGFFTLQAGVEPGTYALLASGGACVTQVDTESMEVMLQPEVVVYDRSLELVLSANLATPPPCGLEHGQRFINVCDLLLSSENTFIYRLDK